MKILWRLLIVVTVLAGFSRAFARAEKVWETGGIYKGPESVAYDAERGFLYVSNYTESVKTGGSYGEHCISKANLKGEILKYDCVGGLTTPTGICISNDKLYIVERFGVVVYDLKADKVEKKIYIKTASFLNDITVDSEGNIYVSESDSNMIYRIADGNVEKWLDSEAVSRPNGILFDDGKLIVGVNSDNNLKAVDVSTKEVVNISHLGPGIIDGVKKCGDGYLVSHYMGNLYMVDASGEVKELINTRDEEINIADFEYIPGKSLVVVPALRNNKLLAYRLSP